MLRIITFENNIDVFTSVVSIFEIREQPSYRYFFFDPHYMYSFHMCLTTTWSIKMTLIVNISTHV